MYNKSPTNQKYRKQHGFDEITQKKYKNSPKIKNCDRPIRRNLEKSCCEKNQKKEF